MSSQDATDGGARHPTAALEQLPLDAALAPTRILAGEAKDQTTQLIRDRRPASAWSPTKGRPAPADQFPVPAEQGGRREQESAGRQPEAGRGQDDTVRRQQLRPLDLAAQNCNLMAEGKDLQVALGV